MEVWKRPDKDYSGLRFRLCLEGGYYSWVALALRRVWGLGFGFFLDSELGFLGFIRLIQKGIIFMGSTTTPPRFLPQIRLFRRSEVMEG